MMSFTKNLHPQPKIFFRVQTTRLAESFETLNSSLPLSAPELRLCKVMCNLVVLARNPWNMLSVKELTSIKVMSQWCCGWLMVSHANFHNDGIMVKADNDIRKLMDMTILQNSSKFCHRDQSCYNTRLLPSSTSAFTLNDSLTNT